MKAWKLFTKGLEVFFWAIWKALELSLVRVDCQPAGYSEIYGKDSENDTNRADKRAFGIGQKHNSDGRFEAV